LAARFGLTGSRRQRRLNASTLPRALRSLTGDERAVFRDFGQGAREGEYVAGS